MTVQRADSDLHQSLRQPSLHDARKWASMRKTAAFEFVIQIRMRVEMNHGEFRVLGCKGFKNWISNGVVPAQRNRQSVRLQQRAHGPLNLGEVLTAVFERIAQLKIAGVGERGACA